MGVCEGFGLVLLGDRPQFLYIPSCSSVGAFRSQHLIVLELHPVRADEMTTKQKYATTRGR